MKRLLVIVGLVILPLLSFGKSFGVGIIAGEPTGLSFKYFMSQETAIDLAVAWSFTGKGSFHLHGDFLWHIPEIFKVSAGKFFFFFGAGAYFKIEEQGKMGIRIPVGLSYMFEKAPVDIFIEIAPLMCLYPETRLGLNGGIGVRFFF